MKKRILLLLPLLLLTSCDDPKTTDVIQEALTEISSDITLTGTSVKKREFLGLSYTPNNTEFTNEDTLVITDTRYKLVSERSDGETIIRQGFADEQGYVAEQYLTYKNEIALKPIMDNLGNVTLYENEYGNPFADLTSKDLVKSSDTTYLISEEKSLKLCHKLLGEDVSGEIELTYEDGAFTNIRATNLTGETFFVSTQQYTPLKITLSFDYEIKASAETISDAIVAATNENPELETALADIDKGFRFNNLNGGEVSMSTFFDGTNALYQMFMPDATEPMIMDMYFLPNEEDTMDLYFYNIDETTEEGSFVANDPEVTGMYYQKVGYDYLVSDIANLSASVFKKTGENTYVPEDAALERIGEHIIPGVYDALNLTSYDELRYKTSSMTLTLVDENTINMDYVAVISNGATTATISASFQFAEIGECQLPYQPTI